MCLGESHKLCTFSDQLETNMFGVVGRCARVSSGDCARTAVCSEASCKVGTLSDKFEKDSLGS